MQSFIKNIVTNVKTKFRFATINFIFVMLFITVMSSVFGAANSIVAIIFVQIMMSTINRDLTANPIKNVFIQTFVLLFMGIGGCIATNMNPTLAIPINFMVLFLLLYAYTFEYLESLYFPYTLSYLFFVCLAPISYAELPLRVLCILVGSITIIAYQWVNGRKRMVNTSKSVLFNIIEQANNCIHGTLKDFPFENNYQKLRSELCKLSKLIYDRRKRTLCISDAAFATIDVGRGLETLVIQLTQDYPELTSLKQEMFYQITFYLACFKSYISQERDTVPPIDFEHLDLSNKQVNHVYQNLNYIRDHLLKMNEKEKRTHYQKNTLSYLYRIQSALAISQVRITYALRVALLLTIGLFVVEFFHLEHGRWLLFTITSISLPYADDIKAKAKKRIIATLIGGAIGFVCFSFISDITIRTIILTLSGYITFYLSDYATTFACATIGALGGSIMTTAFTMNEVGSLVVIRFSYIFIGVIITMLFNLYVFPFYREKATRQLAQKYMNTSQLLSQICQEEVVDSQLYYSLVIQIFLQEETLRKNASVLKWNKVDEFLENIQKDVRKAHHNHKYILSNEKTGG